MLILGAGDLGQVVAEMVADEYEEIAFLDDDLEKDSEYPIIGKTNELERFAARKYSAAVCAFGNNQVRQRLRMKAKELGFFLPTVIHPSSSISASATIGEGTIIRENVAISRKVVIEPGCVINMGVLIDHCCLIGHDTHLPMGVIVRNGIHVPALSVFRPCEVIE